MNQQTSSKKFNLAYCPIDNSNNKRGFSAKGLSLLPLALRPRLFKFRLAKLSILPIIVIFSLLYIVNFIPNNVSAASITLTIPKTLSLNVNPAANNGFAKSNPESITVSTDNSVGYTLNIKAKNETNGLLNGDNKIVSISNNLSESDFQSSSQSNIWGFLPSKLYNAESGTTQDNSNFIPGPKSTEDTTIDVTDSANTEPNNYDISLGAKVDSTIPAGSYSNTFVISAVTNELPYEKMQNWEGCDSLEEEQTITLMDSRDNKLYTVSKLKDGKCWMTQNLAIGSNDSTTPLDSTNTDISESYTLPQGLTTGFKDKSNENIYVTPTPDDNNYGGYYTYATATAGTNPSSGEASSSICPKGWRLPTNAEFNTLTSSYTHQTIQNAPANFVLAGFYDTSSPSRQGAGGYWWSSTAQSSTEAYYLNLSPDVLGFFETSSNKKSSGDSIRCVSRSTDPTMQNVDKWASTIEKGESLEGVVDTRDGNTYTVARLADGKLWMTQNLRIGSNSSTTQLEPADTDISESYTLPHGSTTGFSSDDAQNIYINPAPDNNKYGGYYTWPAATAGTNPSSGEASSSICPKGWRLPTKAEFDTLANNYNITSIQQAPANFVLAGHYGDSSPSDTQGIEGGWWSSRAYSSTDAYRLYMSLDFADFGAYNIDKRRGYPIRCVSRTDDPKDVGYMQDVDAWGPSIQKGQVVIATDTRDGNTYKVARLEDNNLWMVENLRLGDSKLTAKNPDRKLTSADSDVSADYTVPESSPSGFTGTNPDKVYVPDEESGNYKMEYGGYYTWVAATAGTGASITTDYENAPSSICPKGWRLPKGSDKNDNNNEFALLVKAYGGTGSNVADSALSAKLISPALPGFVFSGYYNYSSPDYQGSNGYWWSSTSCLSNNGYSLNLNSSGGVSPLYRNLRYYGYSLRCITREASSGGIGEPSPGVTVPD